MWRPALLLLDRKGYVGAMASVAQTRLLTAEEFLQIDFGPNLKAELDNGVVHMMAGGTREHARVQANLIGFLRQRLRGSGCRPYGSDMGVRAHDRSVRYPDVTIDCGGSNDDERDLVLSNPRVVIEVLSPSTRDYDLRSKREDYRAMSSVDTIAFIDPDAETLIIHQRYDGGWNEALPSDTADLHLPALGITIPHTEIFARD